MRMRCCTVVCACPRLGVPAESALRQEKLLRPGLGTLGRGEPAAGTAYCVRAGHVPELCC